MIVVKVDIYDDGTQVIRKEFPSYDELKYWLDRRRGRSKLERCRVISAEDGYQALRG